MGLITRDLSLIHFRQMCLGQIKIDITFFKDEITHEELKQRYNKMLAYWTRLLNGDKLKLQDAKARNLNPKYHQKNVDSRTKLVERLKLNYAQIVKELMHFESHSHNRTLSLDDEERLRSDYVSYLTDRFDTYTHGLFEELSNEDLEEITDWMDNSWRDSAHLKTYHLARHSKQKEISLEAYRQCAEQHIQVERINLRYKQLIKARKEHNIE